VNAAKPLVCGLIYVGVDFVFLRSVYGFRPGVELRQVFPCTLRKCGSVYLVYKFWFCRHCPTEHLSNIRGIFHRMNDSALMIPHILPLRQCFVSCARKYRDLAVLCTDCRCSSTTCVRDKLLYLLAGRGSCSIHNVLSFSNLPGDHVPHNPS
jgi:hypothetical protein